MDSFIPMTNRWRFCVAAVVWVLSVVPISDIQFGNRVIAEPIHFDFEDAPDSDEGDGLNPMFVSDDFSLNFSATPIWVVQWVDDFRSRPHSGIGSIRLSNTGGTPFLSGEGHVNFSLPVESVTLYAGNSDSQQSFQPDFSITAYGPDMKDLGSIALEPSGNLTAPVWSHVVFEDVGPISGLKFYGMGNYAVWDDLTVTVIPEPTTVSLFLVGTVLFFVRLDKRRS